MVPAPFSVVLDACVLYPFTLRDTLLTAAYHDLYRPHWSCQILDEVERNLLKKATTPEKAGRIRAQMVKVFPEAMITGHHSLIDAMPNHEKDRHVVAAAVKAGAQVIVTNNLRDFQTLPSGIEAHSPDRFLCDLFDLSPSRLVQIVREQASRLKNPPRSFDEVVVGLARFAPDFASAVSSETP